MKLHVPLGGFQCGEKNLQKENFVLRGKITDEESYQDLLKSFVSFGGGLEGSDEEKMGRQQKEEVLQ